MAAVDEETKGIEQYNQAVAKEKRKKEKEEGSDYEHQEEEDEDEEMDKNDYGEEEDDSPYLKKKNKLGKRQSPSAPPPKHEADDVEMADQSQEQ